MDPAVERFGRAWNEAADALEAEATSDSPGIPGVQRAMAGAEREFVTAFPKLETTVAQRFRALILNTRKLTPRNLASDGPALATQMRDAWLLVEVGRSLEGGGKPAVRQPQKPASRPAPPKIDAEFAAAFGLSPEQARAKAPTHQHAEAISPTAFTAPTSPLEPRPTLSLRQRFAAVRHSPITHASIAALAGLGLVYGLTLVVPKPQATSTIDFNTSPKDSGGSQSPNQPRRVIAPVTGLGRDGPIISVTVRPRVTAAPASWSDPIAVLDWVDQHYANPTREGFLEDLSDALRSGDSPWRDVGTAGALADTVAYGLTLTTYGHRQNLLPSEVLYHRGGDREGLALAFAWIGWRLGLPLGDALTLSASPQDRILASLEGGFPFGPSPRTGSRAGQAPLRALVLSTCLATALRAADTGHDDLDPLLRVLEQGDAPAASMQLVSQRHSVGRLIAAGDALRPDLAEALLALDGGPELLLRHAGSHNPSRLLTLAIHQLGGETAPIEWLEALHQAAPHSKLISGQSTSEAIAIRLLTEREDHEIAIRILKEQVAHDPAQLPGLLSRLRLAGLSRAAGELALQQIAAGDTSWPVVRIEAVRRLEAADQLGALALLISALHTVAAGLPPRPWEDAEPAVPLDVLRQAQALAISLHQWEHARWLASVGFAWHPKDPVLWRLWTELLAATGETIAASAARSRLPE